MPFLSVSQIPLRPHLSGPLGFTLRGCPGSAGKAQRSRACCFLPNPRQHTSWVAGAAADCMGLPGLVLQGQNPWALFSLF